MQSLRTWAWPVVPAAVSMFVTGVPPVTIGALVTAAGSASSVGAGAEATKYPMDKRVVMAVAENCMVFMVLWFLGIGKLGVSESGEGEALTIEAGCFGTWW